MEELNERKKIVDKIVKLMAMAALDSGATEGERENANRLLAKLMADYAIDIDEIKNSEKTGSYRGVWVLATTYDYRDYEALLANCIAKIFDCTIVVGYNDGKIFPNEEFRHCCMCFVGHEHDLAIAVYFFKYVRRTMFSMYRKHDRSIAGRKRDKKNSERNYCFGFVDSVAKKLEDIYKKREELIPSDCRALILTKKNMTEEKFKELFPKTRKSTAKKLTGDYQKYSIGAADGKRINLSRPIEGSSTNASQIGG